MLLCCDMKDNQQGVATQKSSLYIVCHPHYGRSHVTIVVVEWPLTNLALKSWARRWLDASLHQITAYILLGIQNVNIIDSRLSLGESSLLAVIKKLLLTGQALSIQNHKFITTLKLTSATPSATALSTGTRSWEILGGGRASAVTWVRILRRTKADGSK